MRIGFQAVHFCLQVQQVRGPIYVDGAIRTAGAKVMPFTSQHACELKCWGDATLGGRPNLPATSVSLCISTCPAASSSTPLSPSPHPGGCFIHISRSPYCPAQFVEVSLVPHPPSQSFMCPLLPGALCTGARRPAPRLSGNHCCPALCVPVSLLHVATASPMPRESGLHSSKRRNMASISQKVRGPG